MGLPSKIPSRVGRYRLIAPIASGGAATVYLGRATGMAGFTRVVAVKVLHPHLLDEAASQAAEEFIEEAKLSARMKHPLIVPVLDVGESDEGFYLVMEYIDGPSLSEMLRKEAKLPLRITGRILADVLEALSAAHNAVDDKGVALGIVHRDFSPQNILVGLDGRSRLTDFGIARATTRAEYTRTGFVKGKVAYMAPEQAQAKELDERADVWAAGVVAWELLAGQRIYPRMDPVALLLKITSEDAPRLAKAAPELPSEVCEAVHSALVRNQDERCSSAKELRRRIVDALGGTHALASHEEMGEFVRGLELERLAKLQAKVQAERESYRPPQAGSTPPPHDSAAPTASETAIEGATEKTVPMDSSGTFATTSAQSASKRTKSQGWARFAIPGALALAIVVGLLTWPEAGGAGPESPPAPMEARQAKETLADIPTEDARQEPQRSTEADADLSRIQVGANEPIETIFVGDRGIVLRGAAKVISVELTDAEADQPQKIRALTQDGREAAGTLEAGTTTLELFFEEPASDKKPPAPVYRPPRKAAQPKATPGLAPLPY